MHKLAIIKPCHQILLICVAYDGLDRFFPKEKLIKTGNPIRQDLLEIDTKTNDAKAFFKLSPAKQTLLVLGGSLGSKRINELIEKELEFFQTQNVQVIWQCGKLYYDTYKKYDAFENVQVHAFLNTMDFAYAAADVIISRAGASSVSELCVVGKPVIFIPSPNVAEDHQTKNAKAIVDNDAALLIKEADLDVDFENRFSQLVASPERKTVLGQNIRKLALVNATNDIVDEVVKLLKAHLPSSQREETQLALNNDKQHIDNNEKVLPLGKDLGWASNVYFLGIGGIGMSALARYFVANNKHVAGYDKTKTDITEGLEGVDVKVNFEDDISQIPSEFLNPENTLIVYTPAIPKGHKQFNYFVENGFQVMKRSAVLGDITKNTFCLAVAGTHGKTTTTSILGHLLNVCDVEVTAFLGGISENYNSNFILNGTKVTVVEADEFDRSFLTLSPDMACITSMDADHLDIYGEAEMLQQSFVEFSKKLKPNGKLFVRNGLPIQGITYGIEDNADYSAQNIKIINGSYVFDVKTPTQTLHDFKFNLPGRHNLSNALIALAMAVEFGCPHQQLAKALASYTGVKRRFTYQIKTDDLVFIDDYAHHPEEINAVHQAVREMYPNQKVLAIFQPHLFSRTRDFADDFAKSLSQFDEVLLLDIYPARELPIEGITSEWLLTKMTNSHKKLIEKLDIINAIKQSDAQIILTIGAGDIGEEVKHIKQALKVAN